ncbi:MAG: hypothetical protein V3U65_13830 [Granulosicoccaceae bacterium]
MLKRLDRDAKAKVIDLSAVRASRKHVADLENTLIRDETLALLPPCFALYTLVQNHLSVIAEILLPLPPQHRFYDQFEVAKDLYTPEGPPISPLTNSFYTNWAQYDVAFGLGRETLTTISIAVARKTGMNAVFLELAGKLANSRCSVYEHRGTDGNTLLLRELWTNREVRALNATGYNGKLGEIWYTRLLPPNNKLPGVHVNFNTPYVMHPHTHLAHWLASIERMLAKAKGGNPEQDFYNFMKFGPEPLYWTEYVFEAYSNHTDGMILLHGLPDQPETRPHSDAYQPDQDTHTARTQSKA